MRESGVLLPISAQMGEFGIGDMGPNSRFFIDFIRQMDFSIWQVLPITTIGAGNSPYSGLSSFAGNPLLIDLYGLIDFVSLEEIDSAKIDSQYKVDYSKVKVEKERIIRIAFSRLSLDMLSKISLFAQDNSQWLPDYALYMALKKSTGKDWWEWDPLVKYRNKIALDEIREELTEDIMYYYFEQYMFFKQWYELKTYANSVGVQILGDMPIYVSYDSVDVWVNKEEFLLDKDLNPTFLSGVPPDYFATEGQFWGNPLYDYQRMKKNGYKWLATRISNNLKIYDLLRIDHFRGLYEYWSIPSSALSAKEGRWEKGPGNSLWENISLESLSKRIIVEDLGIIDKNVTDYRKNIGFPGMRVIQFGFDGDVKNTHLPHNFDADTVAYTATHDNSPTLGWLYELPNEVRNEVLDYFGFSDPDWGVGGRQGRITKVIARSLIASVANRVILPMQDLSAHGSDTRVNVPGVPQGNWEYRCTLSTYEDIDVGFYKHINTVYGRGL